MKSKVFILSMSLQIRMLWIWWFQRLQAIRNFQNHSLKQYYIKTKRARSIKTVPMEKPSICLKLLSVRLRPKFTSTKTARHISGISGNDVNLSIFSTTRTSKTLIVSIMIVVMVMMNDLSFRLGLVSLTGFIICGVVGIHLVGSVVSCFLVHKELLAGP